MTLPERNPAIMNNKRILQTIGVIFLTLTTSVFSTESASDQQKNHSTTIDNHKTNRAFITYARVTSYKNGDPESRAGKTSSGTPIREITRRGLKCIAVGYGIPYLSIITFYDNAGQKHVGVAVDTGGAVKSRKAAIKLALARGLGTNSPEYRAPVIDIYASRDMTPEWTNVMVIPYTGPSITSLKKDTKEITQQKILIRNQQLDLIQSKIKILTSTEITSR